MNKTIKVSYTPKLIRQSLMANATAEIFFIVVVPVVGVLQSYVEWDYCGCLSSGWIFYDLAYLMVPAVFISTYGYAYFRSLKMLKNMKSPVFKYRLTDKWLYVNSDIGTGKNAWILFRGIRKGSKIWQIIVPNNSAFLFPVEMLDKKTKDFLSNKIPRSHRNLGWYSKFLFFLMITTYVAYSFIQWFIQLGDGK